MPRGFLKMLVRLTFAQCVFLAESPSCRLTRIHIKGQRVHASAGVSRSGTLEVTRHGLAFTNYYRVGMEYLDGGNRGFVLQDPIPTAGEIVMLAMVADMRPDCRSWHVAAAVLLNPTATLLSTKHVIINAQADASLVRSLIDFVRRGPKLRLGHECPFQPLSQAHAGTKVVRVVEFFTEFDVGI